MKEYKGNVFVSGQIIQFGKTPVELLETRVLKDNSIVLLSRILYQVNKHKGSFHYSDEFFYNVYGYTEARLRAAKKGLYDKGILIDNKIQISGEWRHCYLVNLEALNPTLKELTDEVPLEVDDF